MLTTVRLWWLKRGLRSSDLKKYVASAEKIIALKDPRAVDLFLKDIESKDQTVRKTAALALGEFSDVRSVKPLMTTLANDASIAVREASAKALGRLGNKQAVPTLIRTLGDREPGVRTAASKSLSRLGENFWHDLIKGTDDDFERLKDCNDRRAIDALLLALKNEKWHVRSAALEGLGKMGDKQAVPHLQPLASDDDQRVRLATIRILVALQDKRSIDTLIHALGHKDPETRAQAARALADFGEKRAVVALRKRMEDKEEVDLVSRAVVEALTKLEGVH
ncbi:MAG TPA: HEAT repeat domain-containing protein [Planctomycetota bacterium]|jgi:HEAT repeat protein